MESSVKEFSPSQQTNFRLSVHIKFARLVELILSNQTLEQCGMRILIYHQQQHSMALMHKDYLGNSHFDHSAYPVLYIIFFTCEGV